MARGTKLDLGFDALQEGWSVDSVCPGCGENRSECRCETEVETEPPSKHRLVFKREKRRGKPVTLVGEFHLEKKSAADLLKRIKKSLGSGGAMKKGWMEIQGDKTDALKAILTKEGFAFKR
jgi:translation initiation factor 1